MSHTTMSNKNIKIIFTFGIAVASSVLAFASTTNVAQGQTNYRLKTMFTGSDKCLDIINDANDNKPIMADCGNYSGQYWQIVATNKSGYYRLKTLFTGSDKCLDIINDSNDNKPIMANCGNYSGQFWQIEATNKSGYYRLKTMFTGSDKCLDIINDSQDNKPIMANCGNYSGQFWQIPNF
ncbi:RICIN domain-containing protein [Moorena bouillonii]|uniref:RICIN domain-containing protein n=1 Tax=Moorena bouillonii TaxID=207920 RepID=UPI0018E9EB71|nr:RICIN domain-containing protein [Moorena bouillonii]